MSVAETYLRGSLTGIVGKASKLVGGYGTLWLLTTILSEEGYGGYVAMFAIASLLALVAQFDLRQATIQRVSELSVGHEYEVPEYSGAAMSWVALAGVASSVLIWLGAPLAGRFADPELIMWARMFALLIPGMAVRPICGGVLRGLERVSEAIIFEQIVPQVFRILLLGCVWFLWREPAGVVAAIGASFYVPIIGFGLITRGWRYLNLTSLPAGHVRYSGYLFANSIASRFLKRTDILLLTALATLAGTGGYNVAWKLAAVARYGDQVLTNVLQPRLSKFLQADDIETLHREFGQVRDIALAASIPVLIGIVLYGRPLLAVFGDYTGQYLVLVVLTVGAVVNGAFGTIGQVLIMGKRGRLILLNTAINLFGNVGLNLLLIPRYGTLGAAIATTLTVYMLTNLIAALEVKFVMGIDTFDPLALGGTALVAAGVFARTTGVVGHDAVAVVPAVTLVLALLHRRAEYLRGLLPATGG